MSEEMKKEEGSVEIALPPAGVVKKEAVVVR